MASCLPFTALLTNQLPSECSVELKNGSKDTALVANHDDRSSRFEWQLISVDTDTYTIKNAAYSTFAVAKPNAKEGDKVVAGGESDATHWKLHSVDIDIYTIQDHADSKLYWAVRDGAENPVTLGSDPAINDCKFKIESFTRV